MIPVLSNREPMEPKPQNPAVAAPLPVSVPLPQSLPISMNSVVLDATNNPLIQSHPTLVNDVGVQPQVNYHFFELFLSFLK